MRYRVLATDYDGTLAHHGAVTEDTLKAMERLLASGRKLVMVTGRELDDLMKVCPHLHLFEWVVAENGALLYRPGSKEEKLLAERPPEKFVHALQDLGVGPMSVGRVIVATWEPHQGAVLDTIRDQGLELQVIFNKGAVMVLPAGVTKATGLAAALKEMGLTPHEAVGIGDAENDHALLSLCECGVVVQNALPALKERADLVMTGDHGVGVAELIDMLIDDDLASKTGQLARHHLLLGTDEAGGEVRLPPFGPGVLVAGPSGSGKSTTTTSLMERLADARYQFCIIDPEGDYDSLDFAVTLGGPQGGPSVEEVLQVLESSPEQNVVVNMIGMRLADRPGFFLKLIPQLQEMRSRTGRPHWLIVDETHHLLPASWEPGNAVPADLRNVVGITVHPDQIHPAMLATVGTVIAVGGKPDDTLASFAKAVGVKPPNKSEIAKLESGEVLLWRREGKGGPRRVKMVPHRSERRRHTRKYAEGELPPDRSFYFRGPEGKLNLRAQNLMLFLQLADGVDDVTWTFHLSNGDYSRWFRERIKDDSLAAAAEEVERTPTLSSADSRKKIRETVESRYTLPATAPMPIPGTDAESVRQ
jgi:hypothetical protein